MSGMTHQTVKTSTTVTVWIRTGADTTSRARRLAVKATHGEVALTLVERLNGCYRFVIA